MLRQLLLNLFIFARKLDNVYKNKYKYIKHQNQ